MYTDCNHLFTFIDTTFDFLTSDLQYYYYYTIIVFFTITFLFGLYVYVHAVRLSLLLLKAT